VLAASVHNEAERRLRSNQRKKAEVLSISQ
jgi:hypothetical protein